MCACGGVRSHCSPHHATARKGGATGPRPNRGGLGDAEQTALEPARPECDLRLTACRLGDQGHLSLSSSSGKRAQWPLPLREDSGRGLRGRVQAGVQQARRAKAFIGIGASTSSLQLQQQVFPSSTDCVSWGSQSHPRARKPENSTKVHHLKFLKPPRSHV